MKPIFVDIETSGGIFGQDKRRYGIWQIGAIDLNNINNYFLEEGRIDDEDLISKKALEVTGKTEYDLRDPKKQSQKQLISNYFDWLESVEMKNLACQNPIFDVNFLDVKTTQYGLKFPFAHRNFDLHSMAQQKYYSIYGKFMVKEGRSGMNLSEILRFCGMEDRRKEHNALEDSKLGGECFNRITDGESLFPEYIEFPVPYYLVKRV